MKKNVLVIGSGGREHAITWKLKQSPKIGKLYVAPGNAGTAQISLTAQIDITDHKQIINFAKENKIDLIAVMPDDPLATGLVNDLQKARIKAFGPTKEASQIEWSKAFAKKFMKEENIPTASYKEFNDYKKAVDYLKKQKLPIVIKASGLALGKGVVIAKTFNEAKNALKEIMVKKIFGKAGTEVIIEEFLEGQEISIHVFCDGKQAVIFPSSKDHKTIFENNRGPNTGGMGTIAPVPWVTKKLIAQIKKTIVEPTIEGLKKRGRPFVGCLYPGLIITKDGPKVLEFNARFGDPETQSYMRLLKTDLFDIFMACVEGKLSRLKIKWNKKSASCVIIASKGYPASSQKEIPIKGIEKAEKEKDIVVFHAGTKFEEKKLITNGGRIIGVTSVGNTLEESLSKTYNAIKKIKIEGMQFRKDIGKQTINYKLKNGS